MTEATLIAGPAWVGDMVMAQVLFRMLKQQQPDAPIDVIAPAWSAPLLARMPEVRKSFDLPLGHGQFGFWKRRDIGRSLRGQYTQSILLPNSWKSGLVPFFAKIPRRTGWLGEARYGLLNDYRKLDKAKYPLMIERFAALALPKGASLPPASELPKPKLAIEPQARLEALARFGLNLQQPILALCPGAEFGPAKRWPPAHYAAVAEAKIRQGWQVWLFGSAKDQGDCSSIIQALPAELREQVFTLAGRTSLAEAIDLLSCADAVVSNDSGLMHIAAALDRPLVSVYGSTSPGFTPPLTEIGAIVKRDDLSCAPCFKRECPLGHLDCLNGLEPARVLAALDALPKAVEVAG